MASSEFDPRLQQEFQFDLLVDGELPERTRRDLLQSLDQAPEQWRDLAIRFLQRQTEQTAAREVIAAAGLETPAAAPFSFAAYARRWTTLRMAAGLLLVGLLSAGIGLYYGQQIPPTVANGNITVRLPSGVGDTPGTQVTVRLAPSTDTVPAFAEGKLAEGSRRDVVIMPNGHNQAVVFAVSTPYIY